MAIQINRDNGLLPQSTVQKNRQTSAPSADATKTPGSDKVSFSAVLQQVSQAQNTPPPAPSLAIEGLRAPVLNNSGYVADVDETIAAERTAKIEELKLQVAEGSYQPDLKKVASSLLTFIAEGRQA